MQAKHSVLVGLRIQKTESMWTEEVPYNSDSCVEIASVRSKIPYDTHVFKHFEIASFLQGDNVDKKKVA